MATGSLKLDLVDVRGKAIGDEVQVELTRLDQSQRYRNTVKATKTVQIGGIECDPFARYRVTLWPSDYRISQFFIELKAGQVTTRPPVVFPVDPDNVVGIRPPKYPALNAQLQRILEDSAVDVFPGLQGPGLYAALDPVRRACLLNISAKASKTILQDGQSCLDHLGGLQKLRGDRFFAQTHAALREETQNAGSVFFEVSEILHHPPDGYTAAGSFKTVDSHGNLQFSFFRRGTTGDDYLVDVDIDEASGIEHGFEVARNFLGEHTTSPYDVREILIRYQGLDPGYDFIFGQTAEVAKSAGSQ